MPASRVTAELIQQARQHDARAVGILVGEWEPDLLKLARRTLRREARALLEPGDVVQEVWLRFFDGVLARLLTDVPAAVLGYVRTMVRHEAAASNHHAGRQKRDAGRVQSLDDAGATEETNPVERRPGPAEEVLGEDACRHFLVSQGLKTGLLLAFMDEGYSRAECARGARISLRTWQRTLHAVRGRAASWFMSGVSPT